MSEKQQDEDDMFLSDIHVELENHDLEASEKRQTRIFFSLPANDAYNPVVNLDEDGDPIVRRKPSILIEHEMKTTLNRVGFQLWRAGFFLIDYLFTNLSTIQDKVVVDLGAGLGLTSLLASLYAKRVYSTDLSSVISQAKRNYELNESTLSEYSKSVDIVFKTLDWYKCESDPLDDELLNAQVYLAADVVYDDMLTVHLMRTVFYLMTGKSEYEQKTCYIVNEKRINFSAQEMDTLDTAYKYFLDCLNELDGYEEAGFRFKCEQITGLDDQTVIRYVQDYKRNEFLYIWKIECFKKLN